MEVIATSGEVKTEVIGRTEAGLELGGIKLRENVQIRITCISTASITGMA